MKYTESSFFMNLIYAFFIIRLLFISFTFSGFESGILHQRIRKECDTDKEKRMKKKLSFLQLMDFTRFIFPLNMRL